MLFSEAWRIGFLHQLGVMEGLGSAERGAEYFPTSIHRFGIKSSCCLYE